MHKYLINNHLLKKNDVYIDKNNMLITSQYLNHDFINETQRWHIPITPLLKKNIEKNCNNFFN